MSSYMEDAGILSTVKLSEVQYNLFLEYLRKYYGYEVYDIIDCYFGENLFLFMDMFSGMVFRVPKRKDVLKVCEYVRIYSYLKSQNFTEDAYLKAKIYYKKHYDSLVRIVKRVESILNTDTHSRLKKRKRYCKTMREVVKQKFDLPKEEV